MQNVIVERNGLKQEYIVDYVAKQASGSVMLKVGNAVLIAAISRESDEVSGDFIPLTVQYVEKTYAAAKIPGGFIKRETKPGEFETLTSRVIDRSLRPLFPDNYRFDTALTVLVVSADENIDMQVMALNAASAALYLSDIPVSKMVTSTRIAKLGDTVSANPTMSEIEESSLDLYVSGSRDELLMIEMKSNATLTDETQSANEVAPELLVDYLDFASEEINSLSLELEEKFDSFKKDIVSLKEIKGIDSNIVKIIEDNNMEAIKVAVSNMAKSERNIDLKALALKVSQEKELDFSDVLKAVESVKKSYVRSLVLNENIRADGRSFKEIRDIKIETNILPSAQGSCLFTRGQTQALVTATIGGDKDAQMYEILTSKEVLNEAFMVHYNFFGFSVGEAGYLSAPSRRELGHGNLCKRALEPLNSLVYTKTVRLVSEILESNGSSSMATICGGSLALKSANIPTNGLVAGIAMGMITDGDKYAILSDIMGLEDHDGDMDFKVAGTSNGITALQMDIKLGGVSSKILKEALLQAKDGIDHILNIMNEAESKIKLNESLLPCEIIFNIDKGNVGEVIGKGGANVRAVTEEFGVVVDIDRNSGDIKIISKSKTSNEAAKAKILASIKPPVTVEIGDIYTGKVTKVMDFGAFVMLESVGVEALLHVSKLSEARIDNIHDFIKSGEEVQVEILGQKGHKIELKRV